MRRTLEPTLILAPLLALAACEDARDLRVETRQGTRVEIGGRDSVPDRFAIHTRGGELKLALTEEQVYVQLSDSVRAGAQEEMDDELRRTQGLGGAIASRVTSAVSRALGTRVAYDIERVERMDYVDGELRVWLDNGERAWSGMQVNDRDLGHQFSEEEGRSFIAAFEELKRGR